VQAFLPASAALLLLTACPDPRAKYEDFVERVPDAAIEEPAADAAVLDELPDVTGTFFMAFDPVVAPGLPFLFRWQIVLTKNPDGTGSVTVMHQALTTADRQPIGAVTTIVDIPVPSTGELVFSVDDLIIPGPANAVSGTELHVDLDFDGVLRGADRICGDALGGVNSPFVLDLSNSTWSAIRVPDDALGNDLPPPELKCPAPVLPDGGVEDAGVAADAGPADAAPAADAEPSADAAL